jgi:hypothetical protein
MWTFVKIDSMATRNVEHDAELRLVESYNAQTSGQNRKRQRLCRLPACTPRIPDFGLRRLKIPSTAPDKVATMPTPARIFSISVASQ